MKIRRLLPLIVLCSLVAASPLAAQYRGPAATLRPALWIAGGGGLITEPTDGFNNGVGLDFKAGIIDGSGFGIAGGFHWSTHPPSGDLSRARKLTYTHIHVSPRFWVGPRDRASIFFGARALLAHRTIGSSGIYGAGAGPVVGVTGATGKLWIELAFAADFVSFPDHLYGGSIVSPAFAKLHGSMWILVGIPLTGGD
jgi:hypothetical protein